MQTHTEKQIYFLYCPFELEDFCLSPFCFSFTLGTVAEILPQNRKRKVNHERRSWRKEDRTWRRKQRSLCSSSSAWCAGGKLNVQLNIFLQASEEDGPPETGILTAQTMDKHDGMRRRRRKRHVSRLWAASWLCEKWSFGTELNKINTQRAQPGILKREHFVFSCTNPPFSSCVQ